MCIPNRLIATALLAYLFIFGACRKPADTSEPVYTNGILFPFRLTNPISSETFHAVSLLVDSKENKWITYRDVSGHPGIISFDGNSGNSFPNSTTPLPLHTDGLVTVQTEDAEGGIYFTSNEGDFSNFRLFRYKNGTWTTWNVQGIPCREIYFNRNDGKLYFIFLDNMHAILPSADFSRLDSYNKVTLDINGSPTLIHSAFDGENFHLISSDRYFVVDSTGYALFYTPTFNDLLLSYINTPKPNVVYTIGGTGRNQIYKLHEGRWARFPVTSINLNSITVDEEENVYVTVVNPGYYVGKYSEGNVSFFTYGNDQKALASEAPVAVDSHNVKWVAVAEGIVRLP